MAMTINQITTKTKDRFSESDQQLIKQAYDFASHAHQHQKRATGEPFIQHSLHTAFILMQIGADASTIAAGLLHDVPEDTDYTLSDLKKTFGPDIAFLVQSVTKLNLIKYHGQERYRESLKRMFLAMAKDLRVVLIKFADRLHNLRTLEYLPETKQQRIAQETLEIYVPIANLLGIWRLKWQMEDLCFKYLHPNDYKELVQKYEVEKKLEFNHYIDKTAKIVSKKLNELKIKHEINGRFKHLYSIWQKMNNQNRKFDEIYDVFALRIIVDDVDSCYRVLGAIHNLWRPNNARFKDYIALPKPNGYQSLHTTVFGLEGKGTEFQIRTKQMHQQAQYGIVAHWAYKEYGGESPAPSSKWAQDLLSVQKNSSTTQEFLKKIQTDILNDYIFILTPKGDIYELPISATPIDFAYAVHTEVGNQAKGVLVNNKIGHLDQSLKNNDLVEIIIDQKQISPDLNWLKFVKTNKARNAIQQHARRSALARLTDLKELRSIWQRYESRSNTKKPPIKKS